MFISKYILYIKVYKYIYLQTKAQSTLNIHSVNMNTQVLQIYKLLQRMKNK